MTTRPATRTIGLSVRSPLRPAVCASCRAPARVSILLLAALSLCCPTILGQSSKSGGTSTSGSSSTSTSGSSSGSSGQPFSIETEMFTYKAVEHNSAVIACDTAQFLYHGDVAPAAGRAPCAITGNSAARPGIILISSGSTLLSDFQVWRTDIATMQSLVARAKQSCIVAEKASQDAGQPPQHLRSRGLLGTALGGLADPSEAASVAGDVIKMFSKDQSVSSVIGTVRDPALMNEVARQLRSLNIQVIVPELYNPGALATFDAARSPYLQSLQSVFDADDKCREAKSGAASDSSQASAAEAVLASIDAFLKSAFSAAPPAKPAPASPAPDQGAQTEGAPAIPASHLGSVLTADAVAVKIGFSTGGVADPSSPWQNLLWVKALESGGSVSKQSSLFGTKVFFGGGAVDTYSVFSLDGNLVCSGNVYSFQQPVNLKDVGSAVHAPNPDTPAKWESEHGTCAPPN